MNYRAKTKGKVERPFYYLQEHLLRGLQVRELSEFDVLLSEFTERYNARRHSELKESPNERFKREEAFLKRLPLVEPKILYNKHLRKVSNDGYISWDGALYPVSMKYSLKDVYIFDEWGKVFDDNVVASAIIDRLVHHASIFYITGSSYRMKNQLRKAK